MAELTIDQRRALALAAARKRATEAQQTAGSLGDGIPAPSSQAYTDALSAMSDATRNPARGQYEALPGWQKPIVAASDALQLVANGATFGFGDKAVAAARAPFTGKSYEEELADARAKTEGARQRAGSAATAAELTGAVAAPLGLANRGLTLAGRFGTAGATGLGGTAARASLMGLEGAGYGALTAAGNDQDIEQGAQYGVVGGALGSAAGEALAAGVGKVAGAFNRKPVIPTANDLSAAKTAAYNRAEQAGVTYTPVAVGRVNQRVVADLTDMGFDPALQPGAAAALKRLQDLQGQNVTLKGLDTVRKVASNGYIPGNRSNNMAVSRIIDAIDEVVDSPATADVLIGNAQAGASALQEARGLAAQSAKLERVNDAISKAELRAASTGSGGNVDNATRQNLRRLLEKPRGFTQDERAALEAVVRGTGGQNALRLAGKLSPSGNGLMAALGVGGAMVNPMIGAASLGGMGAKALADNITQKNVQKLTDIILAGGKKSATQAAPNAVQRLTQSKRDTIARILMAIGAFEAGTP